MASLRSLQIPLACVAVLVRAKCCANAKGPDADATVPHAGSIGLQGTSKPILGSSDAAFGDGKQPNEPLATSTAVPSEASAAIAARPTSMQCPVKGTRVAPQARLTAVEMLDSADRHDWPVDMAPRAPGAVLLSREHDQYLIRDQCLPSELQFWLELIATHQAAAATPSAGDAGTGIAANDVARTVSIHNETVKRTWEQIAAWFPSGAVLSLHSAEYVHAESAKAVVKRVAGYGSPFMRLDWTVKEAGSSQSPRTFIAEYYLYTETCEDATRWPTTCKMHVDVRPALVDAGSMLQALSAFPTRCMEGWSRPRWTGLTDVADPAMRAALFRASAPAVVPEPMPTAVDSKDWKEAQSKCSHIGSKEKPVGMSAQAWESQQALDYTRCMGTQLCPARTAKIVLEAQRDSIVFADTPQVQSSETSKALTELLEYLEFKRSA